jgi:serine/threonine-protein kinase RsbW
VPDGASCFRGLTLLKRDDDPKTRSCGLSRDLLLKIELLSDPKALYVVRGAVERLAETVGFAGAECRSVVRAVDEALTNIMRHCYCGRVDQPIELYFRRLGWHSKAGGKKGLEILLCDRGPAVDQSKLRARRPSELRPGGLGLQFIREAMDSVGYKRVGHTNRLRLVKYLPSEKPSRRNVRSERDADLHSARG